MVFPVVSRREIGPAVRYLEIEAPLVARKVQAGQFVILRADERGERIPLTVFGSHAERGTISVMFQVVGGATMALDRKRVGDVIPDLVGPLGVATETEGVRRAIVVGGGVGCAIALPVARRLFDEGCEVHAVIGFRSRDLVLLEEEFHRCSQRCLVTTDDGSYGMRGNVCLPLNMLLEEGKYDAVYLYGPLVMMKYAALTAKPFGVKTIASMDPIMIDGTGMCGCCRVTVGGEMKFACVDGPDFDAQQIDFDEAIARSKTYLPQEAAARERHCMLYRKEVRHDG